MTRECHIHRSQANCVTMPYSLLYTANSILSAMEINFMNIIDVSVFVSVAIIVFVVVVAVVIVITVGKTCNH